MNGNVLKSVGLLLGCLFAKKKWYIDTFHFNTYATYIFHPYIYLGDSCNVLGTVVTEAEDNCDMPV